jgi:superfamily I DNA/RNA helicase
MKITNNQELVLGPPGCGKTHYLLGRLENAFEQGYSPDRIAFVSFTKKAVNEAIDRTCRKFHLSGKDLPYFRTVHSLCFRALRMTKSDMMDRNAYTELGDLLGYKFDGTFDESETGMPTGGQDGDRLLFTDNFARITCRELRDVWENDDTGLDWFELLRMKQALEKFKDTKLLLDFTDLLNRFVQHDKALDVDVAIIDEAQDLSQMQWRVLRVAFRNAAKLYIAGDDDQSIYKWSGADTPAFMSLEGEKKILNQSYRIPRAVYTRANEIITKVGTRFDKPFLPRDADGFIDVLPTVDYIKINSDETTLILVRNVFLLDRIAKILRNQGHPFLGRQGYSSIKHAHIEAILTWEHLRKGATVTGKAVKNLYDHMQIGMFLARGAKVSTNALENNAQVSLENLKMSHGLLKTDIWHEALEGIDLPLRAYYLTILKSGRKLTATPKITINTIHGVKGGEADHVIVLPDMSSRTFEQYQKDPTDEHRVGYVAVTRAKERLSLVLPSSTKAYSY